MSEELKHCCEIMNAYAEKINNRDLIDYMPEIRSYSFLLHRNGKDIGLQHDFWYCPWCGTELPESVGDVWDEILEKEYGLKISDFFNEKGEWDESRIPEEFKSDAWWKKRGL